MQVQVSRWGNGLGVRLPKELAAYAGITDGSRVEVTLDAEGLRLRVDRPVYRLDEILAGIDRDALREAFDWGEDRGVERVE